MGGIRPCVERNPAVPGPLLFENGCQLNRIGISFRVCSECIRSGPIPGQICLPVGYAVSVFCPVCAGTPVQNPVQVLPSGKLQGVIRRRQFTIRKIHFILQGNQGAFGRHGSGTWGKRRTAEVIDHLGLSQVPGRRQGQRIIADFPGCIRLVPFFLPDHRFPGFRIAVTVQQADKHFGRPFDSILCIPALQPVSRAPGLVHPRHINFFGSVNIELRFLSRIQEGSIRAGDGCIALQRNFISCACHTALQGNLDPVPDQHRIQGSRSGSHRIRIRRGEKRSPFPGLRICIFRISGGIRPSGQVITGRRAEAVRNPPDRIPDRFPHPEQHRLVDPGAGDICIEGQAVLLPAEIDIQVPVVFRHIAPVGSLQLNGISCHAFPPGRVCLVSEAVGRPRFKFLGVGVIVNIVADILRPRVRLPDRRSIHRVCGRPAAVGPLVHPENLRLFTELHGNLHIGGRHCKRHRVGSGHALIEHGIRIRSLNADLSPQAVVVRNEPELDKVVHRRRILVQRNRSAGQVRIHNNPVFNLFKPQRNNRFRVFIRNRHGEFINDRPVVPAEDVQVLDHILGAVFRVGARNIRKHVAVRQLDLQPVLHADHALCGIRDFRFPVRLVQSDVPGSRKHVVPEDQLPLPAVPAPVAVRIVVAVKYVRFLNRLVCNTCFAEDGMHVVVFFPEAAVRVEAGLDQHMLVIAKVFLPFFASQDIPRIIGSIFIKKGNILSRDDHGRMVDEQASPAFFHGVGSVPDQQGTVGIVDVQVQRSAVDGNMPAGAFVAAADAGAVPGADLDFSAVDGHGAALAFIASADAGAVFPGINFNFTAVDGHRTGIPVAAAADARAAVKGFAVDVSAVDDHRSGGGGGFFSGADGRRVFSAVGPDGSVMDGDRAFLFAVVVAAADARAVLPALGVNDTAENGNLPAGSVFSATDAGAVLAAGCRHAGVADHNGFMPAGIAGADARTVVPAAGNNVSAVNGNGAAGRAADSADAGMVFIPAGGCQRTHVVVGLQVNVLRKNLQGAAVFPVYHDALFERDFLSVLQDKPGVPFDVNNFVNNNFTVSFEGIPAVLLPVHVVDRIIDRLHVVVAGNGEIVPPHLFDAFSVDIVDAFGQVHVNRHVGSGHVKHPQGFRLAHGFGDILLVFVPDADRIDKVIVVFFRNVHLDRHRVALVGVHPQLVSAGGFRNLFQAVHQDRQGTVLQRRAGREQDFIRGHLRVRRNHHVAPGHLIENRDLPGFGSVLPVGSPALHGNILFPAVQVGCPHRVVFQPAFIVRFNLHGEKLPGVRRGNFLVEIRHIVRAVPGSFVYINRCMRVRRHGNLVLGNPAGGDFRVRQAAGRHPLCGFRHLFRVRPGFPGNDHAGGGQAQVALLQGFMVAAFLVGLFGVPAAADGLRAGVRISGNGFHNGSAADHHPAAVAGNAAADAGRHGAAPGPDISAPDAHRAAVAAGHLPVLVVKPLAAADAGRPGSAGGVHGSAPDHNRTAAGSALAGADAGADAGCILAAGGIQGSVVNGDVPGVSSESAADAGAVPGSGSGDDAAMLHIGAAGFEIVAADGRVVQHAGGGRQRAAVARLPPEMEGCAFRQVDSLSGRQGGAVAENQVNFSPDLQPVFIFQVLRHGVPAGFQDHLRVRVGVVRIRNILQVPVGSGFPEQGRIVLVHILDSFPEHRPQVDFVDVGRNFFTGNQQAAASRCHIAAACFLNPLPSPKRFPVPGNKGRFRQRIYAADGRCLRYADRILFIQQVNVGQPAQDGLAALPFADAVNGSVAGKARIVAFRKIQSPGQVYDRFRVGRQDGRSDADRGPLEGKTGLDQGVVGVRGGCFFQVNVVRFAGGVLIFGNPHRPVEDEGAAGGHIDAAAVVDIFPFAVFVAGVAGNRTAGHDHRGAAGNIDSAAGRRRILGAAAGDLAAAPAVCEGQPAAAADKEHVPLHFSDAVRIPVQGITVQVNRNILAACNGQFHIALCRFQLAVQPDRGGGVPGVPDRLVQGCPGHVPDRGQGQVLPDLDGHRGRILRVFSIVSGRRILFVFPVTVCKGSGAVGLVAHRNGEGGSPGQFHRGHIIDFLKHHRDRRVDIGFRVRGVRGIHADAVGHLPAAKAPRQ